VALIGFSKYSLLANFLCKKIVIRPHVTPTWDISLTNPLTSILAGVSKHYACANNDNVGDNNFRPSFF